MRSCRSVPNVHSRLKRRVPPFPKRNAFRHAREKNGTSTAARIFPSSQFQSPAKPDSAKASANRLFFFPFLTTKADDIAPASSPSASPQPDLPSPAFLSSPTAMDHGRDPCPYVILNDFGGAFAMGVRVKASFRSLLLPSPHLGITTCCHRRKTAKHHSETDRLTVGLHTGYWRNHLARHQGLPKLSLRRAPHRRHHRRQDAGARPGRQLWCLGRSLLDL